MTEQLTTLLDASAIAEVTQRIADEILVAHGQDPVALVGIYSRGAIWAERVYDVLKEKHPNLELGKLDISLYRDDLDTLRKIPMIRTSEIPDPIDETTIILFDDVFYTGRTIRAAMEVLSDYGRPAKVELAVLIDRGLRELPIAANYVGCSQKTVPADKIRVRFQPGDEEEVVCLVQPGGEA